MNLLMTHGYMLSGTGSNVYVQNLCRALTRMGHDVHLLCQEPNPLSYDFVNGHYRASPEGIEKLGEKRDHKKAKSKDGYVTALLTAAEQISQTVQGVEVGGGAPPPEVSRDELWIKWNIINPRHRRGRSDEDILATLNQDFENRERYGTR